MILPFEASGERCLHLEASTWKQPCGYGLMAFLTRLLDTSLLKSSYLLATGLFSDIEDLTHGGLMSPQNDNPILAWVKTQTQQLARCEEHIKSCLPNEKPCLLYSGEQTAWPEQDLGFT